MHSPMLHLPKKGFPLTFSLARERIYSEIHLKEELQKRPTFSIQFIQEDNKHGYSFERRAYWFVLKATRVFHISTGKAGREWWTLSQWLTLPLFVRDKSLEYKSMLIFFMNYSLLAYVMKKKKPATIFIIFWDFLVFCQISLSPQVKQCPMITCKHDLCELPHELPKDLRS